MQALFYHDRPTGSGVQPLLRIAAMAVAAACTVACGHSNDGASPQTPAAQAPAPGREASAPTTSSTTNTPTVAAIASGRAAIEQVRAAAGGPSLTAVRSFELDGVSTMNTLTVARQLQVLALFPGFFRQDEGPLPGTQAKGFHTIVGLENNLGWILGARLGGDGSSPDREVAQRAYSRAARQAMAGFLAGINAPWLIDSGKYTPTLAGTVTAGEDRDALIILLDGPDGRVGQLLVDPHMHLPRRLIEPPQPGGGGAAAMTDIVFTYSNYQPQDGLQLPHTIIRENGRNRTVWSINRYTLNPRLTPRRFMRNGR